MIINLEFIKSLNPCDDRLNNYESHYGDKGFTVDEFVKLKKISSHDKKWVLLRHPSLMRNEKFELGCQFARRALHFYNKSDKKYQVLIKAMEEAKEKFRWLQEIIDEIYIPLYGGRQINHSMYVDCTYYAARGAIEFNYSGENDHLDSSTEFAAACFSDANRERRRQVELIVNFIKNKEAENANTN